MKSLERRQCVGSLSSVHGGSILQLVEANWLGPRLFGNDTQIHGYHLAACAYAIRLAYRQLAVKHSMNIQYTSVTICRGGGGWTPSSLIDPLSSCV